MESFADKQISIFIHYSICYTICLSILYIYRLTLTTEDWDRYWIIQFVKIFPTEKIFARQFSVVMIHSILTTFLITMEILSNSKMKCNSKNEVCHINAWKTAYPISHFEFCFKLLKHVQNFSLKNSWAIIKIDKWRGECS